MKIYFVKPTEKVYMENTALAINSNIPRFTWDMATTFEIQILNSDRKDAATGAFNDFYTGLAGDSYSSSLCVDNNCLHYKTNSLVSGVSGTITQVEVKASTPPRAAGSVKLINTTGGSDSFNYFNYIQGSASDTYILYTSDSSFIQGPVTLTYTYAASDVARVSDYPLIKIPVADMADKDTGLIKYEIPMNNLVLQREIEGQCSLSDNMLEFVIYDSTPKKIMIHRLGASIFGVLDYDALQVAPAPVGDYFTKAEVMALVGGGSTVGDMTKAVYDPQGKEEDIFKYAKTQAIIFG